jgi:hypothetical protein
MVEINSNEHQPKGLSVNPHLEQTFDAFFSRGYQCVTADSARIPIDADLVRRVATGQAGFGTHNFLFS